MFCIEKLFRVIAPVPRKNRRGTASLSAAGAVLVVSVTLLFGTSNAIAAEDLKVRAGISFTQDIESGFPIEGTNLDDCKLSTTTPTLVFFGASGDLNTNRQSKRLVDLYKKVSPRTVKFVVIDVDHPPNDDAKNLIKNYYHGFIPSQVIFDKHGKNFWSHDGEVETALVKSQVDKAGD